MCQYLTLHIELGWGAFMYLHNLNKMLWFAAWPLKELPPTNEPSWNRTFYMKQYYRVVGRSEGLRVRGLERCLKAFRSSMFNSGFMEFIALHCLTFNSNNDGYCLFLLQTGPQIPLPHFYISNLCIARLTIYWLYIDQFWVKK